MPTPLKVLGIHGLGDHRESPWAQQWEQTLREHLPGMDQIVLTFVPFTYDEIFERIEITTAESLRAFWKLTSSGLGGLFRREAGARGLGANVQHWLRWYAGYVVAWVEDEEFRTEVRQRLLDTLVQEKPDVVVAHSLGSLISYDALTSPEAHSRTAVSNHLPKMTYVTLGSQLGNAFVVGNLTPGRIDPLPVKQWYHLYNSEDDVFTAEIRLPGVANFLQVLTHFDIEGFADHDALEYLKHPATVASVWEPLTLELATEPGVRAIGTARVRVARPPSVDRVPRQRALLVGINEYPRPADRLAGCVNDVFLMSSVLQECDFTPDQIRVVLDDRATAQGILERLHWLLDGAAENDLLFFYYSGHGAQLPTYGEGDLVDRMDETLVPYNFDWSPETSITDDHIFHLYSQLPYDTRLVMVFDCCHSGGMHRDGGLRIRGLEPPDDIRHRALRWDAQLSMWVPRDFKPLNENFSADEEVEREYTGSTRAVLRLGRAMPLRQLPAKEYEALKRRRKGKAVGPYLPMILQACQEDEFAYEYRHGVQSYGAFTYSLADILRKQRKVSFEALVKRTGERLADLGYDQVPAILGPEKIVKALVPWHG